MDFHNQCPTKCISIQCFKTTRNSELEGTKVLHGYLSMQSSKTYGKSTFQGIICRIKYIIIIIIVIIYLVFQRSTRVDIELVIR